MAASTRRPGATSYGALSSQNLKHHLFAAMAAESVHDTNPSFSLREKDGPLEPGDHFEDAREAQTPPGDELTVQERAALTRRVLLKLDLRC